MTCPHCGWELRRRPMQLGSNVSFRCSGCGRFYLVGARFLPAA